MIEVYAGMRCKEEYSGALQESLACLLTYIEHNAGSEVVHVRRLVERLSTHCVNSSMSDWASMSKPDGTIS
jgi:hypothetical protein